MARLDHNASPSPVSRLPSYRSSHMGRYHPYPRLAPSLRERKAKNFDAILEGDAQNDRPQILTARVDGCVEQPDPDTSPYEDEALVDNSTDAERLDVVPMHPLRRSKLAMIVSSLIAAVRRHYPSLESMRDSLMRGVGEQKRL
ncbi:hypothetical protein FKP32DRAFT_1675960 [Trametes sanguinea]|nr:hypothetical protein FKP32DRAFT_1675960 [Trametes sanguinea]